MGARAAARIAAFGLGLSALAAPAQPVTVYRCVGAEGAVSLQDRPCPPQAQQQRRDLFAPAGAASEPQAPAAEPAAQPEPALPTPPPPPPPPLWACENWKHERYLSETGVPIQHCVPVGALRPEIALGPNPVPGCEWVADQCRRLDGEAACRRWRQRRGEVRDELRIAFSDRAPALRDDLARIENILRESCGR